MLKDSTLQKLWNNGYIITLLLPLLFINVPNSHDWGGDFAQYIHQAINLVEGISQSETGYIYNYEYALLGPETYPMGFPILLAPVYSLFGNSIHAFTYFMSILAIVFGIICLKFFKRFTKREYHAILMLLVIVYNPWFLRFKAEVLAEIPLLIFFTLILSIYLSKSSSTKKYILLGLLSGYMLLIKSIGLALVGGILLNEFVSWLRKENTPFIKNSITYVASSALLYALVSLILFPSSQEAFSHFSGLVAIDGSLILKNLDYYTAIFQQFFNEFTGSSWSFINYFLKAFALLLAFFGFLSRLKKPTVLEYTIICGAVILLVFTTNAGGFRYLLPFLPILMIYIYEGFKVIKLPYTVNEKWISAIIFFAFILVSPKVMSEIIEKQTDIKHGPQEPVVIEAFEAIDKYVPEDAIILFSKPRVLALYTARKSMGNNPDPSSNSTNQLATKNSFDFILYNTDLSNPDLELYIEKHTDTLELLWTNDRLSLYKRL